MQAVPSFAALPASRVRQWQHGRPHSRVCHARLLLHPHAASKAEGITSKPAVKVLQSTPAAAAAAADLPKMLDTIGQAFLTDELHDTMDVAPEKRPQVFRGFAESMLKSLWQDKVLYYTEGQDCVGIVFTKEQSKGMGMWTLLSQGMLWTVLTAIPLHKIPKLVELFSTLQEEEEVVLQAAGVDNYVKLSVLGSQPAAQGRGLGSAVLRAISADADAAGVPLYLEASNSNAARLYERHGYQTLKVVRKHGKEIPLMLRPPAAAAGSRAAQA